VGSPYSTKGAIILIVLAWLVVAVGYGVVSWVHVTRQRDD
jgi:hypothetical protein